MDCGDIADTKPIGNGLIFWAFWLPMFIGAALVTVIYKLLNK